MKLKFKQMLSLIIPKILRVLGDQPNLNYKVQMVSWDSQSHIDFVQELILIFKILEICWQSQITYYYDTTA